MANSSTHGNFEQKTKLDLSFCCVDSEINWFADQTSNIIFDEDVNLFLLNYCFFRANDLKIAFWSFKVKNCVCL